MNKCVCSLFSEEKQKLCSAEILSAVSTCKLLNVSSFMEYPDEWQFADIS